MTSKEEIKEYLTLEGQRLDNDMHYWRDQLRLYPLPSVASSYQLALIRREVFNNFCHDVSVLLDLDGVKLSD